MRALSVRPIRKRGPGAEHLDRTWRMEGLTSFRPGAQLRLLIFLITALLLGPFAQADVSLERRGPIVIAGNGRINLKIHLDSGAVDYLPVDAPGRIVGASAGIVLQPAGSRLLTTQYPTHSLVEPAVSPLDDRIGKGQQLIVRHSGLKGSPTLEQVFRVYDDRCVVLIELRPI